MKKVYLFVEITVKPEGLAQFIEKISAHGEHIRSESGCENLEIFQETENLNQVCVWEIWSNRAFWDIHMANEASKEWQVVAKEFVISEKITVMGAI